MVKKFTVFFVAIFLCSCLFAYAQHAGNKDFSRKEAENSSFKGMDLSGAKFIHTDLDNSNFEGTNLTGADFTRAELENCNFKNANLTNVNFSHADLEKATWIDGKVCAEGSIGNCN